MVICRVAREEDRWKVRFGVVELGMVLGGILGWKGGGKQEMVRNSPVVVLLHMAVLHREGTKMDVGSGVRREGRDGKVGPGEVGPGEVGPDEVGLGESRDAWLRVDRSQEGTIPLHHLH